MFHDVFTSMMKTFQKRIRGREWLWCMLGLLVIVLAPIVRGQAVDPLDGPFNPTLPGVPVVVAQQPDGNVIFGGKLFTPGMEVRGYLVRVLADGYMDASFAPYFYTPNTSSQGIRSVLIEADGKILVGGEFTHVNGIGRVGIARLLPDGSLDTSYVPTLDTGRIHCLARQADGKILVAGTFVAINGVPRNSIARLNADGTLDTSFSPTTNNVDLVFVQADGKILLGGTFTSVNGVTRSRLARLNADGTLDAAFSVEPDAPVSTIAQQADGKLLIGGTFTLIGTTDRNRLARLILATGALDATFNPNANAAVQMLALQANGQILLGGAFTQVGGVARNYFAKLNPNGSVDLGLNPAPNASISAIAIQSNGRILVGGGFSTINGANNLYSARLPNNTSAVQTLSVTGNNQIDWARSGATPELEQVMLEQWTSTGWTSLGAATRVTGGWRRTGLSLPPAGWIRARGALPGGSNGFSHGLIQQVIGYGLPTEPDLQVSLQGGAPLASDAEVQFSDQNWRATSQPMTFTLKNSGTANLTGLSVLLEGLHAEDFQLGTLTATQLAADASLSLDVTFRPRGAGKRYAAVRLSSNDPDKPDYRILLSGTCLHADASFHPSISLGNIYGAIQSNTGLLHVCGNLTFIDGIPGQWRWRRFNPLGQLDPTFDPPLPSLASCLAEQSDEKMIGGGQLRFSPDGIQDPSFSTGLFSVNCLRIQPDGKILAGGEFTNRLVRLNPDGTTDSSFTVPTISGLVRTMVLQPDGKVVIGGTFTAVAGTSRNYMARLNANGSLDFTFDPVNISEIVNALALQADGKIVVGTATTGSILRLNTNGSLDGTLSAFTTHTTPERVIRSIGLQADGSMLVAGTFSTINHVARNNLARLSPTGVVDPEFDPNVIGSAEGVTVLPDGNIAIVGPITEVGGMVRKGLARIPNNVSAARALTATGTTQLDWQIGDGNPAIEQVVFEVWNGTAWTSLGATSRVSGGWRKTGLSLPTDAWVRASGRTYGGRYNGSTSLVRDTIRLGSGGYPTLVVETSGGAALANPSGIDLGVAAWSTQGVPQTYTLRNIGTADLTNLTFSTAEVTAGSLDDFLVTLPPATSIPAGGTTTFEVQFTPKVAGTHKITITINSNGSVGSPKLLTFLGTANYASPNPFTPPSSNSFVELLVPLPDGKTLVAGPTTFGTTPSTYGLARLTTSGDLDPTFNAGLTASPSALVLQADGKLLVAGALTTVHGQARGRLARLNADGSLDLGFNPMVLTTNSIPDLNSITSVVVDPDGKIILGGEFTSVGGVACTRLARLNPDGSLDATFNPAPNGTVHCLALQPDGKLLVGGDFAQIAGVARPSLARLLPSGALDASFAPPTLTGLVYCMTLLPDGNVLAGFAGQIGAVNWVGVARFSETGAHDATFSGLSNANSITRSMAVQSDGKILVGGAMNGSIIPFRSYLLRLSTEGNLDTTFNPAPDATVYGVSLQEDGQFLVGGNFNNIDGVAIRRMARLANEMPASRTLTTDGVSKIEWESTGSAPLLSVVTLESWNGSGWVSHPITANGNRWQSTGLNLPSSGWIRARGWAQGGRRNGARWPISQIVSYGAVATPSLVVENAGGTRLQHNDLVDVGLGNYALTPVATPITVRNAGNSALTLNSFSVTGTHAADFSVAPPADLDLAPGESTTFNVLFSPLATGIRYAHLDVISNDPRTTPFGIYLQGTGQAQDGTPDAVLNGSVSAMASLPDGRMLIGGNFTTVDGVSQLGLARLLADGSWDSTYRPVFNNGISALAALSDGRVYVAGDFSLVNGTARNYLVRLLPDGSLDTAYNPLVYGPISSMTLSPDGKLVILGFFSLIDTTSISWLARLLPNGTLDTGFNANANSSLLAMALQPDGKLLVSGYFSSIGGASRSNLARLNADGTADASFNPNIDGNVTIVGLLPSGKILIGGGFTNVQGSPRPRLARLQTDGTLDTTFSTTIDQFPQAMAVQADGKVYLGGNLADTLANAKNRLLRLNADGTVDAGFNPVSNADIKTLALAGDGSLFVGGGFTSLGGLPRTWFARLPNNIPATQSVTATGVTQLDWMRDGSCPQVEDVHFSTWNGTAWVDLGAAVAVPGGWQKTGLSLSANALVRGEGRTLSGAQNGSCGVVARVVQLGTPNWPSITILDSTASVLADGSAIDFGNQLTATASAIRTYTLRNDGSALLTGISASLVTTTPGVFLLTPPGVTQLAPGASATFSVQYTPQTWGAHRASIVIKSNDPIRPSLSFPLSGSSGGVDLRFARTNTAETSTHTSLTLRNGRVLLAGTVLERCFADGTPDQSFTSTLGGSGQAIYCLAEQEDGKILVGGNFTIPGQSFVGLARLNQDGTIDPAFNAAMPSGEVRHLILQPDGNLLVGGNFTSIGGEGRTNLALLFQNGAAIQGFNPAPATLTAMALQPDGKILISGQFTQIGSVARTRIARLLSDGSLDATFVSTLNQPASNIALSGDQVIVAGPFTLVNSVTRNYLARLTASGALDSFFNPNPNNSISGLVVQRDGRVYVTGGFGTIGGQSRISVARLLASGSIDTSYNPSALNQLSLSYTSLGLAGDGALLLTGGFTSFANRETKGALRLLNNIAVDPSLTVNGQIVDWTAGAGSPELHQAALSFWNGANWVTQGTTVRTTNGWQATMPGLPAGGWVRLRGRVRCGFEGGSSAIVDRVLSFGVATQAKLQVESASGQILGNSNDSLNFGSLSRPQTMSEQILTLRNLGSAPLVNLSFSFSGAASSEFSLEGNLPTSIGGGASAAVTLRFTPTSPGNRLALLKIVSNDFTSSPITFNLTGNFVDGGFYPNSSVLVTLPLPDGSKLIGGDFSIVGGQTRNRIAKIRPDNTVDSSFNLNASSSVYAMALLPDGKVLVGGNFSQIGGAIHFGIARLNANGTIDPSWQTDAQGTRFILPLPDGKVLIGGSFTSVLGTPRQGLARLHADGSVDGSFNAQIIGSVVCGAYQPDGKILMGGAFTEVTGRKRTGLARLNANGTQDLTFNPVLSPISTTTNVNALAIQPNGKIVISGQFSAVNGVTQSRLARLEPDGSKDATFTADLSDDAGSSSEAYAETMQLQTDGGLILGGKFTKTGSTRRNRLLRFLPSGLVDPIFDPNMNGSVLSLGYAGNNTLSVGGNFSQQGEFSRPFLAVVETQQSAADSLLISHSELVTWTRGGSSPEFSFTTLERLDGASWVPLTTGTRFAGGWRFTGFTLPADGQVRARGSMSLGYHNGSSTIIETVQPYSLSGPDITLEQSGGATIISGTGLLDFGLQDAGNGSRTLTVDVKNNGMTGLQLTGTPRVAISGAHAAEFSVTTQPLESVSPSSSSSFTIAFDPAAVGLRTATVSIASNDPDENPYNFTIQGFGTSPEWLFNAAMQSAGLTGNDALAVATPQKDGVKNLLKYAFNMNLLAPDARMLTPETGTAGLPSITLPTRTILRVEYIRRVGSGLLYTPMKSREVAQGPWEQFTDIPTVTTINPDWERVVYEEPVLTSDSKWFVQVRVGFDP